MARYVFSKKKFTKYMGKNKSLSSRDWINEVKGVVFEKNKSFGCTKIKCYGISEEWCTRLNKVNYPKNF